MSTTQRRNILTIVGIVVAIITLAALIFGNNTSNLQGTAAQLPTATASADSGEPTVLPTDSGVITEQPLEIATDVPTDIPTDIPTDVPTEIPTDTPTEVPTTAPTAEPTIIATIEVNNPPQPARRPRILPAACQMNITDGGDTNPFTFTFSATGREIATYTWDVDAPSGTDFSGVGPHNFTYPTTGTFDISLVCATTTSGTLNPTGKVNIQSVVSALFNVTPGLAGIKPFDIALVNLSTGANLTYLWEVTEPISGFSETSILAEPEFTLTEAGTYTIKLTVTDSVGTTQIATATVIVSEPAPKASISTDTVAGEVPLTVNIEGIDALVGPITTWTWTFTGGSPASATGKGPHSVTYNAEGTYTVRLDYSGPGGGGFAEKQIGVFAGGADVAAAFDYYFSGRDVGAGNAEVCFNNKSTGPVDVAEWDFSYNGSSFNVEYSGLESPICFTYTGVGAGLNFTVRLQVENGAGTRTSNAQQTILVVGAPTASFNFGPNPVTWNSSVNFTDTSTGSITLWEWDFGNGQTFSTTTGANPPAILYNQGLGNHVIRLKVTGPGGSSTTEAILLVERLDIGCNITGTFNPVPNTAQTYTASLSNVVGRTVGYKWSIVGPGVNATGTNNTINQTFVNSGAYVITMTAITADGSECTATKTVQVQYTDPICSISGNFTPYPDGTAYNYTLTVNDPLTPDRTPVMVEWFINGVSQGASTAGAFTFSRSWTLPVLETLKVEAIVTNPDGTKTGCAAQQNIDVKYPPLSCSVAYVTGTPTNPIPTMPDATRTYVYRAQITPASLGGRTIVGHTWTWTSGVNGVVSTNTNPNDTLTLEWLWNQTGAHTASVLVTVQDPLGNTYTCNPSRSITVTIPALSCAAVTGDLTPIIGDNITYTRNVSNVFGRTIYESGFKMELENLPLNSGVYGTTIIDRSYPQPPGTDAVDFSSINYTFNDAGRKYRLSYYVKVLNPDGTNGPTCTRAFDYITTPGDGTALFNCEGWVASNNYTLNPLTTTRTYRVNIDNTYTTPGLPLAFDWVIKDHAGNTVTSGTANSTADGQIVLINNKSANNLGFTFTDNQYTFDVSVRDTSATTSYTCAYPQQKLTVGALNIDYTIPGSSAWDIANQICLTNTSSTSHDPSGNALTYVWDLGTPNNSLGSQTYTGKTPPCFTYTVPGNYPVRVTGTTVSGLMSANKQYTFNVYNSQKIAINYSGVDFPFVGSMTFDAILTNVTFVNWEFTRPDGTTFTRTGDPRTELLNIPGEWTVKATGTGPLGNVSATVKFTLIATDAIAASFVPSIYGGLAPLNVCFTDTSKGDNINKWEWDFNGDGTIDLTYTTPPTDPICYTYTIGETEYPVRLFIENTSGKKANATNYITTYNVVEAGATFNISNEGGGQYCFTPVVDPGINVTGWEFGDGTLSPVTGYVCHTYSYSGTFVVTMKVESGGTPGKVKRPVVVTFGPKPNPVLNASASCAANGKASFTVSNTGDNMPTTDRVTIKTSSGVVIFLDETLKLNNGESRVYTLSGVYDTLTLTLLDNSTVTANTTCYEPPNLSVGGLCQVDGSAVFTVTNTSKDTDANQSYTVKQGATVVDSGMITAAKNGGTQSITVSGVYGPLTFETDNSAVQGATTKVSANTDCDEPPMINAAGSCLADGSTVFTVTNASTDTDANQPYTVKDSGGVTVDSGTITATKGNGTQTITIPNGYTYGALTFETASTTGQGATTVATQTHTCVAPPMISVGGACQADGSVVYTVTNISTGTDANQPYTVKDSGGATVASGTITAAKNGGTQSITVTNAYTYGLLTFETASTTGQGATTVATTTSDCDTPPVLSVGGACQADGSVIYTVTNTSPDTTANQPYTITDGGGVTVASGTITAAKGSGTQSITVTNAYTYGQLTFNTASTTGQGATTIATTTSDCDTPPVMSADGSCLADGTTVFTVTNSSPDTDANQPYTVKDSGGTTVDSGTITAVKGSGTQTISIPNGYTYGALTFETASTTGQGVTTIAVATHTCAAPPMIGVGGSCLPDGTTVFTVTNTSPDTDANQPYTVKDGGGVTVDSGTITAVKGGGTQSISIPDGYTFGPLLFETASITGQGATTVATESTNCDQPPVMSVSGACEIDGSALFIVTNSSTATNANQPYTITNSSGVVVASGTVTATANGGTQEIRVSNIYGYLLFETASDKGEGVLTQATANTDCDVPPTLSGSGTCSLSGEASFIIRNSGEVAASQPYTITDSNGTQVDAGTLDVGAGKSATLSVSGLKGTVTFKTAGAQGETTKLTINTVCDPLVGGIGVTSACSSSTVVFSIINGSATPLTQPYTVTDNSGSVLDSGTLAIAENDTVEITVAKSNFPPMTFLSQGGITLTNTATCSGTLGGNDGGDNGGTPPNNGGTDGPIKRFFNIDRTPGAPDTTPVERPAWETLAVGSEDVCVDWLLYHTDQTADWEIFRLGDEPRYPNANPNLSNSRDSMDIMPSRSPDKEWVVFSSDRDGNWEIYVTRVDNTITRRLTYNTTAKDLDAVWSPDGRYISYETDRDGNWEIYVFDLVTGEERRLTDVPGNDINGYWSHDSKKVAFQSDRSGTWQIYTVDVQTGDITLISDGLGEDIDPAFSFKDDRIAFRSTRDGGTTTRIYVMNADGSDVQAISPEGATASSQTWYVDDSIIAYQSDADGDFDIYVYEFASQKTRLVTDNTIGDYAPTWFCAAPIVIFTSDIIEGDPNIYNTPALPIEANAILVEEEASQMTTNPTNDIYPENTPSEENASLEDSLPPKFVAP